MRKKFLKTKLLVMVMASVSILFTGCGKKDTEDLLPVETLAEQGTDSLDADGIEETYMSPEELDEIEAMKTNPFEDETDEITEAEMASVEAELARQKEEDAKAAEKAAEKDTKKDAKSVSKAEEKKDTQTAAKTDTKKDTTTSTKSETTAPAKQETTSSSTGSSANNNTSGTTTSTPASTPAASTPTAESSQPATPAPAPATPDPATCAHEYVYIGPGLDAPSCKYMGTSFYKCTKCGAGKDETDVPALGHDYSIVQEIIVGDCSKASTVKYSCSRCGDSYEQQENLHADEHTWTTVTGTKLNWDTGEDEPFTKTYCTNCGKMQ